MLLCADSNSLNKAVKMYAVTYYVSPRVDNSRHIIWRCKSMKRLGDLKKYCSKSSRNDPQFENGFYRLLTYMCEEESNNLHYCTTKYEHFEEDIYAIKYKQKRLYGILVGRNFHVFHFFTKKDQKVPTAEKKKILQKRKELSDNFKYICDKDNKYI